MTCCWRPSLAWRELQHVPAAPVAVTADRELPPGYPAAYQQEVMLSDGRRVAIRPILPSEAPELANAIRAADPDTLHRRFPGAPPGVNPRLLEHLTVVDYVHILLLSKAAAERGIHTISAPIWPRNRRSPPWSRAPAGRPGRSLNRESPRSLSLSASRHPPQTRESPGRAVDLVQALAAPDGGR